MKSKSVFWFIAGMVVASVLWILFPSRAAQDSLVGTTKKYSEIPKSKAQGRLSAQKSPLSAESTSTVAAEPKKRRWIDAVNGFTPEDKRAWAQRSMSRVTFARIQQYLAAAPVRPDDLGRLIDLLSYKQSFNYDFTRKSRMSGLPTKGEDFDRRLALEEARLDGEIKALVGEGYFNEMMGSFRKIDDRLYGLEFIGEALLQGEPLSSEQRKKLNEAINTLDPRAARGIGEAAPDPDTGLTSYDLEVAKELEGILSPQQTRIFKEVRVDWNLLWETQRIHGTTMEK